VKTRARHVTQRRGIDIVHPPMHPLALADELLRIAADIMCAHGLRAEPLYPPRPSRPRRQPGNPAKRHTWELIDDESE